MKKEIYIVKKAVATVAILFAISFAANAQTSPIVENEDAVVAVQTQDDGYVVIKFEDLDETVQAAINEELGKLELKIKEVSQNQESKDLKVIAINADGEEVIYLFDETGKSKK